MQFIGVPVLLGSAIVIALPPFASVIPVRQIVHPCAPHFDSAVQIIAGTMVGFVEDLFILDAVAPLVLLVPGELIRSCVAILANGAGQRFRTVLGFMMIGAALLVPLLFGFLSLAWYQILGDGVDHSLLASLLVFDILPLLGALLLVRALWRSPSSWWLYLPWLLFCYLLPFSICVYLTAARLEMLERLAQHLESKWVWITLCSQVCIGVVFVSDQLVTIFNKIVDDEMDAADSDSDAAETDTDDDVFRLSHERKEGTARAWCCSSGRRRAEKRPLLADDRRPSSVSSESDDFDGRDALAGYRASVVSSADDRVPLYGYPIGEPDEPVAAVGDYGNRGCAVM